MSSRFNLSFLIRIDISRLFAEHVYGTFIEDRAGLRLLDIIGEDNFTPADPATIAVD